ncbi:hypothetical protein LTS18_005318 [Coniosporium uncinatum]|uniref:Uncharacterized protein n=1 Tax=Coniosporium uncinatum TaxID=93489 RepID=A0ACC3DRU1_9PEZI|nr:hypothetical protein LTS18_005318 [Coniosporium uncinatum]
MPPKTGRRANSDNSKNSGLAAPGKRIPKKRSDTALNGHHANGTPQPSPPSSAADLDNAPTSEGTQVNGKPTDTAEMGEANAHVFGRERATSDLPSEEPDAVHLSNGNPRSKSSGSPARMGIAPSGGKSSTVNLRNTLALATTILKQCPLRDVIAMLILLLQLPPTVLTLVQMLFTFMTYIPRPSTSSTWSTLPSFHDCFQGAGGSPSIATIVFTDGFVLLLWMTLWVPVQNIALDFAQAVIAISFSGSAAAKNGSWSSPLLCIAIILVFNVARYKLIPQFSHWHLPNLLQQEMMQQNVTVAAVSSSYSELLHVPHGWTRSILGVHILTQGIVRMIRRAALARRETPLSMTSKRNDPETGSLSNAPRVGHPVPDTMTDTPSGSSTDGRPPGPSPAATNSKDKLSSGRKKRKQATQVRSQQPVWAALAHTKVTVSNSMEQTQISSDQLEANAQDVNHIGNADFRQEDDRVWISELGSTDIEFGACLRKVSHEEGLAGEQKPDAVKGIDKSKPFYVRVNGADWSSTRICEVGAVGERGTVAWTGEIFGLTPLSSYLCEFIRTSNDEVIYSASLITEPAPCTDQGKLRIASFQEEFIYLTAITATAISAPTHQTLRPSSPTTTLRNSIAAAEQSLQDQRNRLKQKRKEHKHALQQVRKEVDSLSARLSTAGSQDDRQRQRAMQLKQTIRQAEEAATEMETQASEMADIPEDELQESTAKRDYWRKEKSIQTTHKKELDDLKAETGRELGQIQSEVTTAAQKRERLQLRQSKLNEQYERLVSANAEGLDAQNRRLSEKAAQAAARAAQEQTYIDHVAGFEQQSQALANKYMHCVQQSQHLEALLYYQQQQQHAVAQHSVPTTPEGTLPGTNSNRLSGGYSSTFQFPYGNIGDSRSHPTSLRQMGGRARSSSMLSGVSGFTDDLENATEQTVVNGRKHSNGSGSGSGSGSSRESGNGSVKDPMSPPVRIHPTPIGPPMSPNAYR